MCEFERLAASLKELEWRGDSLVSRYEPVALQIRPDVDKQLENIRSSYSSLLATARQIHSRLLESLAKFEQYEQLLASIGDNLAERGRRLEAEAAAPIPDLQTARERL